MSKVESGVYPVHQNKIKICKLKNKLRIEKNKMYVSTKKGCQIRKELKL